MIIRNELYTDDVYEDLVNSNIHTARAYLKLAKEAAMKIKNETRRQNALLTLQEIEGP